MRANEFLNEVDILGINGVGIKKPETITITIPKDLINIDATTTDSVDYETSAEEAQVADAEEESNVGYENYDELADIVRLSKGEHRMPAAGENHTIAAPAGTDVPEDPVFISPLQQQLELQKQQGGKESPIINQIIDDSTLGSTAGEQPEQSVYHDSPLKDNEFVGASTGAVDKLRNATTTQGANKPWYKL